MQAQPLWQEALIEKSDEMLHAQAPKAFTAATIGLKTSMPA